MSEKVLDTKIVLMGDSDYRFLLRYGMVQLTRGVLINVVPLGTNSIKPYAKEKSNLKKLYYLWFYVAIWVEEYAEELTCKPQVRSAR
jgi:hypothetical protein